MGYLRGEYIAVNFTDLASCLASTFAFFTKLCKAYTIYETGFLPAAARYAKMFSTI